MAHSLALDRPDPGVSRHPRPATQTFDDGRVDDVRRPHTVQRDRLGVLNVAGDLNREGLDLLRQRCRAELAAQVTTLVIDFTGMTDFPSALFSLLAETGATLRNRDARLQMIGLNEAIDLIAGSGKQSTTASTA